MYSVIKLVVISAGSMFYNMKISNPQLKSIISKIFYEDITALVLVLFIVLIVL